MGNEQAQQSCEFSARIPAIVSEWRMALTDVERDYAWELSKHIWNHVTESGGRATIIVEAMAGLLALTTDAIARRQDRAEVQQLVVELFEVLGVRAGELYDKHAEEQRFPAIGHG